MPQSAAVPDIDAKDDTLRQVLSTLRALIEVSDGVYNRFGLVFSRLGLN